MVCAKCQGSKLLPGYKLRKHISKALQARSQAVRTALDRYNTAAEAMSPPRRTLQWQDIVKYAFPADFDLLRDSRNDIQSHQWATPAGRLAMDLFFKIERAHEEIARLNVEIRRVLTYIIDEDNFLLTAQAVVQRTNPLLAHQIGLCRMEEGRFKDQHLRQLNSIALLPGFTGCLEPGKSLEERPDLSVEMDVDFLDSPAPYSNPPAENIAETATQCANREQEEEEMEEEEDAEDEMQAMTANLLQVLTISAD